jgi:hypothetical protein
MEVTELVEDDLNIGREGYCTYFKERIITRDPPCVERENCKEKEYKGQGLCMGHYAQRLRGAALSPLGSMSIVEGEEAPHLILREILRNYISYRDHLAYCGTDVIEHSYQVIEGEPGEPDERVRKVTLSISFSDLQNCLRPQSQGGILSERKREALLYNVVFDWLQKDAAAKMKITPVSVGQYTSLALKQLAARYFTSDDMMHSSFEYGDVE